MSIEVELHPILQKLAGGQGVVEVTGLTTGECLKNLESRFPSIEQEIRDKRGRLRPYYCILVNSKHTHAEQLTTPVKDGDKIEIEIFICGG